MKVDKLKQVVKEILKVKEVFSLTKFKEALINDVYEVKTDKGDFILRIAPKHHEDFDRTKNIMESLMDEIPNKVIISDPSKKLLIYDKIKGETLKSQLKNLSDDQVLSILKDAIKSSKKMSNKRLKGFGWIKKNMEGWAKNTREEVFSNLGSGLSMIRLKNLLDMNTIQEINRLFYENIALFENVEPRFVYCDLNFRNMLIEDDRFKTLIDFDFCISGDPIRMFVILVFANYETKYESLVREAMSLNLDEKKKLRLYLIHTIVVRFKEYCEFFMGTGKVTERFNPESIRKNKEFLRKLLKNEIKL